MVLVVGCGGSSPTGPSSSNSSPAPVVVISAAGVLGEGLNLFVDTDRRQQAWVTVAGDALRAAYPPNQAWGFLGAALQGDATPGRRPGRDLSSYRSLEIDFRAESTATVQVGIKDAGDADDGTETRKTEVLSSEWRTYTYSLSDFRTADLTKVYLLFEVVFNGPSGQVVFVRNVRYVS
ncbi:MAG: hypothetical protein ABL998_16910 [Planctomycetota bacterium]